MEEKDKQISSPSLAEDISNTSQVGHDWVEWEYFETKQIPVVNKQEKPEYL